MNIDDEVNKYLNLIKNTHNATDKEVRIAKLIVLLTDIENRLTTLEDTLDKLGDHIKRYPTNSKDEVMNTLISKKASVTALKNKVIKTRLNINYFFI